jgi:DNA-binding transcriptional ArsR family regulator
MDSLLHALAYGPRREIVRELSRDPGPKHGELLRRLGMDKTKAPQLTKQLEPLENAGLIRRRGDQYFLADPHSMSQLLSAVADADVSAQRVLADRAQVRVQAAEDLAAELRAELPGREEPSAG